MSNVFKEYEVFFLDNSIESYLFYFGLWVWVILYYLCLIFSYLILCFILISPVVLFYGAIGKVKIKIKTQKNKSCDKKYKDKLNAEYINKLEHIHNKKKKKTK